MSNPIQQAIEALECAAGDYFALNLATKNPKEVEVFNIRTERMNKAATALRKMQDTPISPDMTADQLRLHMGELTTDEVLVAKAAIRLAYFKMQERNREALELFDDLYRHDPDKHTDETYVKVRASLGGKDE